MGSAKFGVAVSEECAICKYISEKTFYYFMDYARAVATQMLPKPARSIFFVLKLEIIISKQPAYWLNSCF